MSTRTTATVTRLDDATIRPERKRTDRLAYERTGSGEPLVLVHGIGHRRQGWYPVLDRLAEERDVILVDLPGHGDSPDLITDGRPVLDIVREQFQDLFADLNVHRPHIAGNSLGGRVALELASENMVRSVTTLAPAGFWRNDLDFTYIRTLFATMTSASEYSQSVAPRLARTRAGRVAMFSWLTARPASIDPDAALGDFRGLLRARPALRTIMGEAVPFDRPIADDIPITIAWGTRDQVLRPYQATRARKAMPAATHVRLDRCGHVPMSDNPELIADVILEGSGGVASSLIERTESA
ncbi:alpha/beta fold hydrolase [Antrihabitans cavernicola]|uniref:alpha/beta fold hydrolase n=1 Tax=Antrihabitans cavernicola TaxID=2495913 RepID=UPI001BE48D38|nr:alpha/beta fold hydrolase [Spelaeibacter cavernicola]